MNGQGAESIIFQRVALGFWIDMTLHIFILMGLNYYNKRVLVGFALVFVNTVMESSFRV